MSDVERSPLAGLPLLSGTDNPADPGSLQDFGESLWNYDIVNTIEQGLFYKFSSLSAARAKLGSQRLLVYTSSENTLWLYDGSTTPAAIWTAGGAYTATSFLWYSQIPAGQTNAGDLQALALNNGTSVHRYEIKGKTVRGYISMTFGSNSNNGSGAYFFGVPFDPKTAAVVTVGSADVSCNGKTYVGVAKFVNNKKQICVDIQDPVSSTTSATRLGAFTGTTSTTTGVWQTGDTISINYSYEAV